MFKGFLPLIFETVYKDFWFSLALNAFYLFIIVFVDIFGGVAGRGVSAETAAINSDNILLILIPLFFVDVGRECAVGVGDKAHAAVALSLEIRILVVVVKAFLGVARFVFRDHPNKVVPRR